MALVRIRGVSHDPPDRIRQLQQLLHEGGARVFNIAPNILAQIIAEKTWAGRKNNAGEEFQSFEDFARQPLWDGIDCSLDDMLAICRKRKDVQKLIKKAMGALPDHGEIGGGHSRGDNVTSARGNNPTYALKRLKRDRPDLAERVIAGELSANAAAIEAGFRKKLAPFDQVCKLLDKMSADDHRRLIRELFKRLDLKLETMTRIATGCEPDKDQLAMFGDSPP